MPDAKERQTRPTANTRLVAASTSRPPCSSIMRPASGPRRPESSHGQRGIGSGGNVWAASVESPTFGWSIPATGGRATIAGRESHLLVVLRGVGVIADRAAGHAALDPSESFHGVPVQWDPRRAVVGRLPPRASVAGERWVSGLSRRRSRVGPVLPDWLRGAGRSRLGDVPAAEPGH